MTEKAAKAERSLANTCAKLGITETGKRWLDLCLDPFKDLNMPTAGYPDSVTIPSVVQTIHDSYAVSVPASVSSGNNWDANIFIDQLYNNVSLYATPYDSRYQGLFLVGQGTGAYSRGGLLIRSGPAGSPLGIQTQTFGASFKQDVLGEGDVRLIGIGLEIHNTTSDLYKQGALVCYRVPDAPIQQLDINLLYDPGATSCVPTSQTAVQLIEVPTSASQAIDMPGSIQWEAKDGAYIVPVMSSPTNYPSTPEAIIPLDNDEVSGLTWAPKLTAFGVAKLMVPTDDVQNIVHGFSPSGCFLTGLSYQTTLQVNLTYYVEVFPTKSSVLRRSVQPAPGLDAKALDLYAHIIAQMPVGVEVNDNFLGAFISGIAQIARTAGSWLMGNMGNIAQGAQVVSNLASSINTNRGSVPARITRAVVDEVVEEVNSPAVRREMNRERSVVLSDQVTRKGNEIVVRASPNGITKTEYFPRGGNVSRNTSGTVGRTKIAREKKNRIIDNATKGYAGNRWIDNPKKK